jgi:hypothetical protein
MDKSTPFFGNSVFGQRISLIDIEFISQAAKNIVPIIMLSVLRPKITLSVCFFVLLPSAHPWERFLLQCYDCHGKSNILNWKVFHIEALYLKQI